MISFQKFIQNIINISNEKKNMFNNLTEAN